MKGRKRQTIRCYIAGILVGALVIGMTVCLQGQVKAGYDTGDWVYTYPSTDPLYAATHFHMFAQDSIINSTHAHGNVATKSLDSGVDFGTRTSYYPSGKSTEISYARDLVNLNANAVAGTFVLGSDWKITSDKNAGQTTITNGKKSFTLNAIKYDNILIEKEGKYVIDIDTEFSKLKSISSYWARQSSSSTVNVDIAGDQNARVIDFANTKMTSGVVTKSISYADWTKYGNSITLKNLDTDTSHTGIVVLNIDLKGVSTANMTVNDMNLSPKSPGMANATTKTETSGGEVGSDQYGTVRVVYNLYDSSKSDYVFAGKISWDHRVFGSILAPGATITFGAVNGTIVGKKLIHSGGESHRRDLIGESGSGITEANPTPTPTKKPTATPTKAPTATPTKAPTATPTKAPTATPTKAPTATPTKAPTASPTKAPTATPTKTPAATPTKAPAATPTKAPAATPTKAPTATPTKAPAATPTKAPTTSIEPTTPTKAPVTTTESTKEPTTTKKPTVSATKKPTATKAPSKTVATTAPKKTSKPSATATPKPKKRGNLDVTIYDENTGKRIPDADVSIVDADGNVVKNAKTDSNGNLYAKNLKPGRYKVVVKSVPDGYKAPDKRKTRVSAGRTTKEILKVKKRYGTRKVSSRTITGSAKISTPQTGDSVPYTPFVVAMIISAIGFAGLLYEDRHLR